MSLTTEQTKKLQPRDIIWEEFYRPKTWDDLILPSRIKTQLSNGEMRNYLFTGQPGVGKTSTAYVMSSGRKVKFIDCSSDRGIAMVRDTISEFCSVASFDGIGSKVIILDEIDALKHDSQQALRGTIEKFSKVCRFIATCNYKDKLITPLKSRLTEINFDLVDTQDKTEQLQNYARRLKHICNEQGMQIADSKVMSTIIKKYYPDMRNLLQTLQDMYDRGIKIITVKDIESVSSDVYQDVYELLLRESNAVELYKKLSAWRTKESVLLSALQSDFTRWIIEKHPEKIDRLGEIAVLTHRYGVDSKNSLDLFVTMLALSHEISKTLK